jgi:uncharacterized protein (TIGR02246 family)
MRKILVAWALLHVVVSAIAGPKEDALQIVDRWAQAFADSDVDGIVKLYAPDALFFGTGSKTLVTKPEDIRVYFERALLSNRPRGASLGDHAVAVLSDTAVVITGMDTVTGTKDGKMYSAGGRVTFVVEKRGSEWRIVHFHRSALPD